MIRFILLIFSLFLLFQTNANAQIISHKIYAISHNNVRTDQIAKDNVLQFQAIEQYLISDTEYVEKNSVLNLKIKEYVQPKRGKRDGYLKVELISYTIPSENDKIVRISNEKLGGTLKLSTPKDVKEIAKNAGVTIVGHILKIPGFSQAVAVSKGLINPNPEQNRLQSAGTNLYESTPLTLTEVGENLCIEEDSIVVIKIKEIDE